MSEKLVAALNEMDPDSPVFPTSVELLGTVNGMEFYSFRDEGGYSGFAGATELDGELVFMTADSLEELCGEAGYEKSRLDPEQQP